MTPQQNVMTHGATLIAGIAKRLGAAELARRIATSEGMIRHLATGRRTPGDALKEKLVAFGIDQSAWTVPAAPGVEAKMTPATTIAANRVERESERKKSNTAIARLEARVAQYDDVIDAALASDPPASLIHVTSAMAKRDGVLVDLAKLYGEGELTAAAIHRSRVWNEEILPKLLTILKKHPEAARDFEKAFSNPESDAFASVTTNQSERVDENQTGN